MKNIGVVTIVALAIGTSGCATTGTPLTTDQKIAGCVATVLGGAIIGGLIGDGKGAAIGAGIGGAACGIWLAFENEADKRRLAEAELDAVRTGQEVNRSWQGEDGRQRSVRVVPSTDTLALRSADVEDTSANRVCRAVTVTPSLEGRSADPFTSYSCRNESGDWERVDQKMVAA